MLIRGQRERGQEGDKKPKRMLPAGASAMRRNLQRGENSKEAKQKHLIGERMGFSCGVEYS